MPDGDDATDGTEEEDDSQAACCQAMTEVLLCIHMNSSMFVLPPSKALQADALTEEPMDLGPTVVGSCGQAPVSADSGIEAAKDTIEKGTIREVGSRVGINDQSTAMQVSSSTQPSTDTPGTLGGVAAAHAPKQTGAVATSSDEVANSNADPLVAACVAAWLACHSIEEVFGVALGTLGLQASASEMDTAFAQALEADGLSQQSTAVALFERDGLNVALALLASCAPSHRESWCVTSALTIL